LGACGRGLPGMEDLHLITDKSAAEPSAVKRLLGAFAGLRSSQVLRAALGHLSLFGALVAYTALGGLVSNNTSHYLLFFTVFFSFISSFLKVRFHLSRT
jgi:ABC-type Mn2+/Zn2+ transport system permease subunit